MASSAADAGAPAYLSMTHLQRLLLLWQVLCTRLGTKPLRKRSFLGAWAGFLAGLMYAGWLAHAGTPVGALSSTCALWAPCAAAAAGWMASSGTVVHSWCCRPVCALELTLVRTCWGVCAYRLTLQRLHVPLHVAVRGTCCVRGLRLGRFCRLDSVAVKRHALRPCTPYSRLALRLLVLPVRLLLGTVYLIKHSWHPLFCCPI
jgi:hypothetical protein